MSTPTSSRTSTWVGIALGIVILGLLAAFSIALPEANGDEDSTDAVIDLSLPDTLPGGYTASDDAKAFAGGQLAAQADDIAKQESANHTYGNNVLPDVLGTSASTRTYVANGTDAVFVQVFQSTGGAFAPNSIPDPANTGGQAATEMKAVGDGACILSYGQATAQGQAPPIAFSQCQVTSGELTVQIGSSKVTAEDLVSVADDLLTDLTEDQDQ
ncbi:hypothetical protein ABLE68_05445 [Nocardioides sp. CN2-186]|uniref:hypothetical protein n=1 Tax=Nocardioides tweenelious TaxID=3156607 RepID=UPI0032B46615